MTNAEVIGYAKAQLPDDVEVSIVRLGDVDTLTIEQRKYVSVENVGIDRSDTDVRTLVDGACKAFAPAPAVRRSVAPARGDAP